MSIPIPQFDIRLLTSHADYAACVEMQRLTWGAQFREIVPPTVLKVAQSIGGLVAGAFDTAGTLIGFVFAQAGYWQGERMNWSQMLAVNEAHRGSGVGYRLKLFQRDFCLQNDIHSIYWTYDPLVARNAHFNLNKLGVQIERYVEDFYPENNGSSLHAGMSLDRFIAKWHLSSPHVHKALAGSSEEKSAAAEEAPIVTFDNISALAAQLRVRVQIPADIEKILVQDPASARFWRAETRQAFLVLMQAGHEVTGFYSEDAKAYYILTRVSR